MTAQKLRRHSKLGLPFGMSRERSMRPLRAIVRSGVIPFSGDELAAPVGFGAELRGLDKDDKLIVQESLRRLVHSPILVQSDRLSRFLTFAVEATLRGNADSLKEYTIGVEAYGRRPDFDPSQDSIVRTEARRLRTKLNKYYQEEGREDPVLIEFRPGTYVPTFRLRGPSTLPVPAKSRSRAAGANEFAIAVEPFQFLSGDAFGESCARGLTDEVMHILSHASGISVFMPSWMRTAATNEGSTDRRVTDCLTSDGIVRTEGTRIRVTSRLCNAGGLHVASWRFDAEAIQGELFGALEKIASEIVSCIEEHRTTQLAC